MTPIEVFFTAFVPLAVLGFIFSVIFTSEGTLESFPGKLIVAAWSIVLPTIVASLLTVDHTSDTQEMVCTITGVNHTEESITTRECGVLPVHPRKVNLEELRINQSKTLTLLGSGKFTIVNAIH